MIPIKEDTEVQVADPFRPYERLRGSKIEADEEDRRGPGEELALALFSVFESGDDPLRQVLLESGIANIARVMAKLPDR